MQDTEECHEAKYKDRFKYSTADNPFTEWSLSKRSCL